MTLIRFQCFNFSFKENQFSPSITKASIPINSSNMSTPFSTSNHHPNRLNPSQLVLKLTIQTRALPEIILQSLHSKTTLCYDVMPIILEFLKGLVDNHRVWHVEIPERIGWCGYLSETTILRPCGAHIPNGFTASSKHLMYECKQSSVTFRINVLDLPWGLGVMDDESGDFLALLSNTFVIGWWEKRSYSLSLSKLTNVQNSNCITIRIIDTFEISFIVNDCEYRTKVPFDLYRTRPIVRLWPKTGDSYPSSHGITFTHPPNEENLPPRVSFSVSLE